MISWIDTVSWEGESTFILILPLFTRNRGAHHQDVGKLGLFPSPALHSESQPQIDFEGPGFLLGSGWNKSLVCQTWNTQQRFALGWDYFSPCSSSWDRMFQVQENRQDLVIGHEVEKETLSGAAQREGHKWQHRAQLLCRCCAGRSTTNLHLLSQGASQEKLNEWMNEWVRWAFPPCTELKY